jgi:hypothetical protein
MKIWKGSEIIFEMSIIDEVGVVKLNKKAVFL